MTRINFLKKNKALLILLFILILIVKVFALYPSLVENIYSMGLFVVISRALRLITGWLPISVGDVVYFLTAVWLLIKTVKFIVKIVKSKPRLPVLAKSLLKIIIIFSVLYIVFNVLWGINYNRNGISAQLNLKVAEYSVADLEQMQDLLIEKVNQSKTVLLSRPAGYPNDRQLFERAVRCYKQTAEVYPFLKYEDPSVKTSLFSRWGNYLGFTGYYNPFTGEAQVNTSVPKFVLPYTTCHEMAHQLGYAKENEANFVGYLAAAASTDTLFHYSTYLDLFVYANHEVYYADSAEARKAYTRLLPSVRTDLKEWRDFLIAHRTFLDDMITWAYGKYLNANQQPQGMRTYSEVVGNLIAFYKKTGRI